MKKHSCSSISILRDESDAQVIDFVHKTDSNSVPLAMRDTTCTWSEVGWNVPIGIGREALDVTDNEDARWIKAQDADEAQDLRQEMMVSSVKKWYPLPGNLLVLHLY